MCRLRARTMVATAIVLSVVKAAVIVEVEGVETVAAMDEGMRAGTAVATAGAPVAVMPDLQAAVAIAAVAVLGAALARTTPTSRVQTARRSRAATPIAVQGVQAVAVAISAADRVSSAAARIETMTGAIDRVPGAHSRIR